MKEKLSVRRQWVGFIVPVVVLVVWELLSRSGRFSPLIMPSLSSVGATFAEDIKTGTLQTDLLVSFSIVLRGYAVGAVLGLLLGILMGYFAFANQLLSGFISAMRQIPPLAWIPLLILWVGIGDEAKIILIALGVFYPVLLNTIGGVSEVSTKYLEFAKNYGITKKDVLFHILLPGAAPSIFVGLRLGAGQAWMSIVAAEMIAATEGVGYRINAARNLLQTSRVIAYMVIIGVIGGLMDYILKRIGDRAIKWRR